LALAQELDGEFFRHQQRRREVVGLDPLAQEVAVVGRVGVPEHEVAERLQHDGARVVALAAGHLGQVDAPFFRSVTERSSRAGR